MTLLVDIASWALLLAGGAFCIIGALGLLRLREFYARTHAASLIDSAGAFLMLLGLMLQSGWTLASVKLVMIGLLILFGTPTATHALANAALARGQPLLAPEEPASKH